MSEYEFDSTRHSLLVDALRRVDTCTLSSEFVRELMCNVISGIYYFNERYDDAPRDFDKRWYEATGDDDFDMGHGECDIVSKMVGLPFVEACEMLGLDFKKRQSLGLTSIPEYSNQNNVSIHQYRFLTDAWRAASVVFSNHVANA